MSDNERIYIQLEPERKEKGYGAIAMPVISVLCFMAALSVIELVVPAIILLVAAIVFAWVGLFMCSRIRKRGGTMPYARTFATLGYIVCLLIIIVSVAAVACVVSVGGLLWGIIKEFFTVMLV